MEFSLLYHLLGDSVALQIIIMQRKKPHILAFNISYKKSYGSKQEKS